MAYRIFEVDTIMWAAFILWEDTAVVEQTGRFLGKQDFKVEKSKGQAKVSYTDDNRQKITLTANYDEATDHYVFVADHENGNKSTWKLSASPTAMQANPTQDERARSTSFTWPPSREKMASSASSMTAIHPHP